MTTVRATSEDHFEARLWLENRCHVQVWPGHLCATIDDLAQLIAASRRQGERAAIYRILDLDMSIGDFEDELARLRGVPSPSTTGETK